MRALMCCCFPLRRRRAGGGCAHYGPRWCCCSHRMRRTAGRRCALPSCALGSARLRPARLRLAARLALRVHAPGCPPGRGNLLTYKSVYMYTLCNARGSRCPAGGRYSRLLLPYEGSTPAASGPCASLHKRSRPRRSLVTCQLQRGALLWRSQVGSHFDSTFHSHPTS